MMVTQTSWFLLRRKASYQQAVLTSSPPAQTSPSFRHFLFKVSIIPVCQPGDRGHKAALIGGEGCRKWWKVKGRQTNFHVQQWDGSEEEQREGQRVVWAHNKEFTKGWTWEGLYCCCMPVVEGMGLKKKKIFFGAEFKKHSTQFYTTAEQSEGMKRAWRDNSSAKISNIFSHRAKVHLKKKKAH